MAVVVTLKVSNKFCNLMRICWAKIFWVVAYVTIIGTTLSFIQSLWIRFTYQPTVSSLESSTYPVEKIPFPGVALCNVNKISRKRADNLAHFISDRTGENESVVLGYIKLLGTLYDFDFSQLNEGEMFKMQNILDTLDFQIQDVMKNLTTPCDELLRKCKWNGNQVNCSEIFHMRLTYEGYCCTFNYVKIAKDFQGSQNIKTARASIKNGLTVTLNNIPEDYFLSTLSTIGASVHIFGATDYPDKTSGSLMETIAGHGTENFIEVIPVTLSAVDEVLRYPVEKRECVFDNEKTTIFGPYSQSDCYVDCRIRNFYALCNCIPFMIPIDYDDAMVCTLRDVQCLGKYRSKWRTLQPTTESGVAMSQKESYDGLICPEICYPSCQNTLYDIKFEESPIFHPAFKNATIFYIYFNDRYYSLYKQDVLYYWFEMLSNFGGLFGLMCGISLIYIVDVLLVTLKFIWKRCV